jgi:hypothetical protein
MSAHALLVTRPHPLLQAGASPLHVSDDGRCLVRDGAPFFWLGDSGWMLQSTIRNDAELYLGRRPTGEAVNF